MSQELCRNVLHLQVVGGFGASPLFLISLCIGRGQSTEACEQLHSCVP